MPLEAIAECGSELFALLLHSVYLPLTSVFSELQLITFIDNNYVAEAIWEGWEAENVGILLGDKCDIWQHDVWFVLDSGLCTFTQ